MSKALPNSPIITPKIWLRLNCNPKAILPKTNVFKGVSEFNIELTELSISVCAIAKR